MNIKSGRHFIVNVITNIRFPFMYRYRNIQTDTIQQRLLYLLLFIIFKSKAAGFSYYKKLHQHKNKDKQLHIT